VKYRRLYDVYRQATPTILTIWIETTIKRTVLSVFPKICVYNNKDGKKIRIASNPFLLLRRGVGYGG
jgi:hypothetical protein